MTQVDGHLTWIKTSLPAVFLLLVCVCYQPRQCLAQEKPDLAEASRCGRTVDVAVVGAGPAGTYSAYKLRKANRTVELFEYSNRIGGRIFTASLSTIPKVQLDIGAYNYYEVKHQRIHQLVKKFNLINHDLTGFAKPEEIKYFLRGQRLNLDQLNSGDVPYNLSIGEKEHQANIALYYLRELTGFNESKLRDDQILKLKVQDGRPLYKLSTHEALNRVATPDGKDFLRARCGCDALFLEDVSAADFFHVMLGAYQPDGRILAVKGGMSQLPELLLDAFLDTSERHTLSLNRKLESMGRTDDGTFQLELWETATKDGITVKTGKKSAEKVCANSVILALPQHALTKLDWKPLRTGKVWAALNAVKIVPGSKVFMSFSSAWWMTGNTLNSTYSMTSEAPFRQMYSIKSSAMSGQNIMLASYADAHRSKFMESLNSEGRPIPGSAPGTNKVSNNLKRELLTHLAEAFGIDIKEIPEPTSAISQFWSTYPFGGAWSVWKAGYHCNDVKQTLQHPSLTDDVFIVGSDYALAQKTAWMESALESVDEIFDRYSIM